MTDQWKLPPISILKSTNEQTLPQLQLTADQKLLLAQKGQEIVEALARFKVAVSLREINSGPTVTQFALEPAPGVKVARIVSLQNDLALALAAPHVRIEAPIPGQARVGVELPNLRRQTVELGNLLLSKSKEFTEPAQEEGAERNDLLSFPLGLDVAGQPIFADLTEMPHLLIGGSTGAGKSVFVNSIIASLLFAYRPDQLQFIMIDPKTVELTPYNGIPHLRFPVVTQISNLADSNLGLNDGATAEAESVLAVPAEPEPAEVRLTSSIALLWLVAEMERRYKVLALTGHRSLKSYHQAQAHSQAQLQAVPNVTNLLTTTGDLPNARTDRGESEGPPQTQSGVNQNQRVIELENLPYLVVIVDELADLIMTAPEEVEGTLVRLAQKARAVGIHLILATQRPSVDVVTGLLKANLPTRLAFAVTSQIDSRVILDSPGAEDLLGRGDALYLSANNPKLVRVQSPYVSDEELEALLGFWRNQRMELIVARAGGGAGAGTNALTFDQSRRPLSETALALQQAEAQNLLQIRDELITSLTQQQNKGKGIVGGSNEQVKGKGRNTNAGNGGLSNATTKRNDRHSPSSAPVLVLPTSQIALAASVPTQPPPAFAFAPLQLEQAILERTKELEEQLAQARTEIEILRGQIELLSKLKVSFDGFGSEGTRVNSPLPPAPTTSQQEEEEGVPNYAALPDKLVINEATINRLITSSTSPLNAFAAESDGDGEVDAEAVGLPIPTLPPPSPPPLLSSPSTSNQQMVLADSLSFREEQRLKAYLDRLKLNKLERLVLKALMKSEGRSLTTTELAARVDRANNTIVDSRLLPKLFNTKLAHRTNTKRGWLYKSLVDTWARAAFPALDPKIVREALQNLL